MVASSVVAQPFCSSRPACVAWPGQELERAFGLSRGKLWRIAGDNRWRAVVCVEGVVWVTQEWDLQDYVLEAGQMFLITLPGKVIVQALVDTWCTIDPVPGGHAVPGRVPRGDLALGARGKGLPGKGTAKVARQRDLR